MAAVFVFLFGFNSKKDNCVLRLYFFKALYTESVLFRAEEKLLVEMMLSCICWPASQEAIQQDIQTDETAQRVPIPQSN